MPDITLCTNKECPSKELCYRYTFRPTEEEIGPMGQSYACFGDEGEAWEYCSKYYPNDAALIWATLKSQPIIVNNPYK